MADAAQTAAPSYLMFVGPIDQQTAARIIGALTLATQLPPAPVHLALQSTGGFVGDGIMLYEAFQRLPIDLAVYNMGNVCSIATVAFLGARKRKASAHAAFMLHQSTRTMNQPASAAQLREVLENLSFDDERMEGIVRHHLRLTDTHVQLHRTQDLWFTAKDALAVGIIDEIADFAPPIGAKVFNI